MTPDHHELVGKFFAAALELPPEERRDWLESQETDPAVIAEVVTLLDADSQAVPFLDDLREDGRVVPPGFDDFRLERLLGEGGMGVVYAGRQQHPDRPVAVKILPGAIYREALGRFRREVNLLGRLEHDAIARVYEAGVRGSYPFIAMELVEGPRLDDYAKREDLDVTGKLRLFLEICGGVAYAHGRGIIHRDLKPANVLVAGGAQPKILDFGIARAIDETPGEESLRTRTGAVVGTLPYMSPEQARGELQSIDARTDVYSLGVILFELLSDRRPLDVDGKPLADAVRIICETPAPALPATDHPSHADLDIIARTAMSKEPSRRYETVAALADDVERVLAHQPIRARAPSAAYVFSRFARRHKRTVAAAAISTIALVAATVISLVFAYRVKSANASLEEANIQLDIEKNNAIAQAKRADREAKTANTFVEFVMDTLLEGDPLQGQEPTLRGAIERVAETVDEKLADFPVVRARLHGFVGKMFEGLGRPRKAYEHLGLSLGLFDEHAPAHGDVMHLRLAAAHAAHRTERFDEAIATVDDFLRRLVELGYANSQPYARGLFLKSSVLISLYRFDDAEKAAREGLEIFESESDDDEVILDQALYSLSGVLMRQGRFDESLPLIDELLELRRERFPPDHPYIAEALHARGAILLEAGRWKEAVEPLQEALRIQGKTIGKDHTATSATVRALGRTFEKGGRYEKALEYYRETLRVREAATGSDSFLCAMSLVDIGRTLDGMDRVEESRKNLHEAIRIFENQGVPQDLFNALIQLAYLEDRHGTKLVFGKLYCRIVAVGDSHLPPGHPDLTWAVEAACGACREAGLWRKAHEFMARALKNLEQDTTDEGPAKRAIMRLRLAEATLHAADAEEAKPLLDVARREIEDLKLPARLQRDALTVAIAVYEELGEDERAASFRKALAAVEDD